MERNLTLDDLQKLRILGEGTYGKCYLVQNKIINELCVLKQIEILGMSPEEEDQVLRQAKILSKMSHPSIIKLLAFFKAQNYLNIVMEYANGGDLNQIIRDAKGVQFSENQILNWLTQICLAIKHIHDRKVIHRDLKCQNIFTTKEGIIKLGDFGIAKHLNRTLDKIKTVVGTPYYMSPEICENKDYSFKTDIWSLGVILYEMCALKLPFDANSLPVLALKISKAEYPPIIGNYSRELKKIIYSLLNASPVKRPTINKILQNPLISKRVANYLPQHILTREFSHTTLHEKNIFEKENDRDAFEESIGDGINNRSDLEEGQKMQINSARSHVGQQKPVKTPQAKNNEGLQKFKNFGSNGKSGGKSDKNEKKKKVESFKRREASEPNLAPKKFLIKSESIPEKNQEFFESIEETLRSLVEKKHGRSSSAYLLSVDDNLGFIPGSFQGTGLVSLLWGMQKFSDKIWQM